MKRLLGLLLVVLTSSGALTAYAAPPNASAPASAPTKVRVAFGDPVAQSDPDEALRLRFSGKRGQLVALRGVDEYTYPSECEVVELRFGTRLVEQTAAHLWRLPASGAYDLDYSQTCFIDGGGSDSWRALPTLTLSRVSVTRARVGDRVRLSMGPKVIRAASVRMGERPFRLTGFGVVPEAALRRTVNRAKAIGGYRDLLNLVDGERSRAPDWGARSTRVRSGARYLIFGDKTTWLDAVHRTRGHLNGPPVAVGGTGHVIAFRGRWGDVVYTESKGLSDAARRGDLLLDAEGWQVDEFDPEGRPGRAWHLYEAGTYYLHVGGRDAAPGASLRLRTPSIVKGVTVGVSFTVPIVHGRWALARVHDDTPVSLAVIATKHMPPGWVVRRISWFGLEPDRFALREVHAASAELMSDVTEVLVEPAAGMRGDGSITLGLYG